jgi:asparagine synthetase B (glutamine-hydrolysing)
MGAIAGYTHFSDPLLLHRMMAEQQHRGKGNKICQHLEDGCILAYFATNDPLSTNTSQRYTVVYDGFIANKGSLKEELGARG